MCSRITQSNRLVICADGACDSHGESRGDIDFDQNPNKIRGESIPAKTSKSQHRPNESMMDATRCESSDARSVEVLVVITTMFGHPRQKEKH